MKTSYFEKRLMQNMPPTLNCLFANNIKLRFPSRRYKVNSLKSLEGFNKLQGIDLSHTGLQSINESLLDILPSLTFLNISGNMLRNIQFRILFSTGYKLRWLNMGYNYIKHLQSDVFSHLQNLENLTLSGNPLKSTFFTLNDNFNLTLLKMCDCSLKKLDHRLLAQLDKLQDEVNHTITLDIQDNYFNCSCDTIDFIKWVKQTNVNIIKKEFIEVSIQKCFG